MIAPPTTYFVPGEVTSPRWGRAFSRGCGGHLSNALDLPAPANGFAAFCTPAVWPLLDASIAAGYDWYYGDHAYWGRGHYYRCARNTYQFQPTLMHMREARPHRLEALGLEIAADWRRSGRTIVVCPNSQVYMAHFGLDAKRWALDVETMVKQYSDRPVIIRWKHEAKRRPLALDLLDAFAVVTFSSAAAIEAVTAGVPAFAVAPWSTAAVLGNTALRYIEHPRRIEHRLPFLWSLAEQQWTLAEMASGLTWRSLHAHALAA